MLILGIPDGIDDVIPDIRPDLVLVRQFRFLGIRQFKILPCFLEDSAEGAEPPTAQGDCKGADCLELVGVRAFEKVCRLQGVLGNLGDSVYIADRPAVSSSLVFDGLDVDHGGILYAECLLPECAELFVWDVFIAPEIVLFVHGENDVQVRVVLHSDQSRVLRDLQSLEVAAECGAGFFVVHEQVPSLLEVVDSGHEVSVVHITEREGDEDKPVIVLDHIHDLRDLRVDLERPPPAAQRAQPILAERRLVKKGLLFKVAGDCEAEECAAVAYLCGALPVPEICNQSAELLRVDAVKFEVVIEFGLQAVRCFAEFPLEFKFFGILLYVLVLILLHRDPFRFASCACVCVCARAIAHKAQTRCSVSEKNSSCFYSIEIR